MMGKFLVKLAISTAVSIATLYVEGKLLKKLLADEDKMIDKYYDKQAKSKAYRVDDYRVE